MMTAKMITRGMKATCGMALILGALVACGDDTSDGTGGTAASGGSSSSDGGGGSSTTGGMGGMGVGGMATGGSGGALLNGCSRGSANDDTGSANVTVDAWELVHQDCTVVDTGTAVLWEGDFSFHPLAGGEASTEDMDSPITGNTPANNEVTVTFADAGVYPYYCTVHGASMQGVIYVE